MINTNTILDALIEQLSSNVAVSNAVGAVLKMEYVNVDPDKCPWCCVYQGDVNQAPRTLGYASWQTEITLRVVVQASSYNSGDECGQRLSSFIIAIMDAINVDRSLSNTVDMLSSVDIKNGFVETDRASMFFQTAIITLKFEVESI